MLGNGNLYEWFSSITVSQILIPSIIVLLPSILLTHFNRNYSIKQEKNKFLIFLKYNSKSVSDFCNNVSRYKYDTAIKHFLLLEGVLIGIMYSVKAVSYIAYLSSISDSNFINKIFPYFLLYTSPEYNNKPDLVDNFLLVSSFNYICFIVVVFTFIWIFFLESKDHLLPNLTKNMSLTKWSKFVYYSYWFLAGALIGIHIFILFFTLDAILKFNLEDLDFSISWIYFYSIFTNLKTQIPNEKILAIISPYIYGIYASTATIFFLYRWITIFPIYFKGQITDFYITKFPHILVKTDSGETLGQLSDFQNNSLLMLNENGVFKAIPWDQIVTMELNNKEEEQPIKVLNSEAIHPR